MRQPLEEAVTVIAVLLCWKTMLYCSPALSVTLVVLRRSYSAAHAEGGVGCDRGITGQGCREEMMEGAAWRA
jgi:hypothetical protein